MQQQNKVEQLKENEQQTNPAIVYYRLGKDIEVKPEQKVFVNNQQHYYLNSRIPQIQGLQQCKSMQIISFRKNLIKKIKGLQNCKYIQQLQLYDNQIKKIQNLDMLVNIIILDLSYNNISKIQNLQNLKHLQKLYLTSNKIKKIENLGFQKLVMLQLGNNKIREIQNLNHLPSLESLFLGKNKIKEVKNLDHLPKLWQLALGVSQIHQPNYLKNIGEGLLPLKNSLRQLYMQQNFFEQIDGIDKLLQLEIVDFSYNKLKSLKGLQTLQKLDALYINSNQIVDKNEIELLLNNSKLTTIFISNNPFTKQINHREYLIQHLKQIDDIDGVPVKTHFNIIK